MPHRHQPPPAPQRLKHIPHPILLQPLPHTNLLECMPPIEVLQQDRPQLRELWIGKRRANMLDPAGFERDCLLRRVDDGSCVRGRRRGWEG
jgi:hypothetical protein